LDRYQAVLLIDQADRRNLEEGQSVRMKLEHLADQTVDGRIATISSRSLTHAPPALSNKFGGPLPTVTELSQRERLTSAAFQAAVPLDVPGNVLRTGMRGRARVIIHDRSAWDCTWSWLRATFRLRV